MPARYVNYKRLREQLDILRVLDHFDVAVASRRGDQITSLCPLPGHPVRHDARRRTPSFSANVRKNVFQCFGCGASGNAVELYMLMSGVDPDDPSAFRNAAIEIVDELRLDAGGEERSGRTERPRGRTTSTRGRPRSRSDRVAIDADVPEAARRLETRMTETTRTDARPRPSVVNAPLDFTLDHLDPTHPYLNSRGLTTETIDTFGLGYCARGMLKDRIAIPVHDPTGTLIGYCGRDVDDGPGERDVPKYRFPGTRERNGVVYEFRKSALVFNAHRIAGPVPEVLVVEGFFSVFHLHQLGVRHAVALMGSSCSPKQAAIIAALVGPDGRIRLMPDGDEAGQRCAESALPLLASHRFCRWARLDDGQQPTDLNAEALRRHLDGRGVP
jgi:DNA primase